MATVVTVIRQVRTCQGLQKTQTFSTREEWREAQCIMGKLQVLLDVLPIKKVINGVERLNVETSAHTQAARSFTRHQDGGAVITLSFRCHGNAVA